ncbi:argininosuccinate lyase [uncultured Metabacillus sp.]|uniref:argininosuccinate lyase n=1 Tax=uncultured Metabacillus sp. TaxID=2860135 RepID=UPI0026048E62|nr:argininosuccinate lyase [uncultured Metabacillus sp.]
MSSKRSPIYIKHILEPGYRFTKKHFLSYMIEINIAHAFMLAHTKILREQDAMTIIQANQQLLITGFNKDYDPAYEDLFFMIEAELKKEIGEELVGNMHIAFSRNDMDATMYRMVWRERLVDWMILVTNLKKLLHNLAKEHELTVMPAYTHNQQAQPTTFAHYILAIDKHLERDLDRGLALLTRINQSPMGAAALGTTGFPIDRDLIAKTLAFAKPLDNSYDSISAADYMLEIASTLSIFLSTLSRFVYDLLFLTTNEVDAIIIDESLVQTSSIMPQKRNPSSLEHTRSLISRTIGELQSTSMMTHSVPFGDIVDIGDDIQPIIEKGYSHSVQIVELLIEILSNMTIRKDKLFKRCQEGFSTATELADVLVRDCKLSFRQAHQLVQVYVKSLANSGKHLQDGNAEQLKKIAKKRFSLEPRLTEEQYKKAIDPYQFILVRSVLGGPNPKETERQRIQSAQRVEAFIRELNEAKNTFRSYKDELRNRII